MKGKIPAKKRTRNKDEKIRLIYDTFFDLVQKTGYANLSTNHIAESAEISIGTIYRYFPRGKIDIIKKYYDTTQQEIMNIEDLFTVNERDFLRNLQNITRHYIRVHRENMLVHSIYKQAMLENQEVLDLYRTKVSAFIRNAAIIIIQNLPKDSSSTQVSSPEQIEKKLYLIYNMYEALTHQHLSIMPLLPTDEEFADYLVQLFLFTFR